MSTAPAFSIGQILRVPRSYIRESRRQPRFWLPSAHLVLDGPRHFHLRDRRARHEGFPVGVQIEEPAAQMGPTSGQAQAVGVRSARELSVSGIAVALQDTAIVSQMARCAVVGPAVLEPIGDHRRPPCDRTVGHPSHRPTTRQFWSCPLSLSKGPGSRVGSVVSSAKMRSPSRMRPST
jgi:hypothetical protein